MPTLLESSIDESDILDYLAVDVQIFNIGWKHPGQ